MQEFDVIVIGTGQAGPSMAVKCASKGLKTAIIEKNKFGGTCVNTGCTPTKAMVASARTAYVVSRAQEYGIDIDGSIKLNLKKVMQRKDDLVQRSSRGVEAWLRGTPNLTVIRGHARFTSNKTIQVDNQILTAPKIFINTGARPFVPEVYKNIEYLTSSEIMKLDELPEHLIIIGGSYIGLEFGQIFRRFGSNVTIIEQGNEIVAREDKLTSITLRSILEEEGIVFKLGSSCIKARSVSKQKELIFETENGVEKVIGSHVLVATGRRPNSDDIGLSKTNVSINARGFIEVNNFLETSVSGIWALGDVNGQGAFTHTAYNDFEIVAANLFDEDDRKVSDRILNYSLYTDPSLSHIGMYEYQAKESGKDVLVGFREMSRIARAKERGETKGFIKILVDAHSKKILGATILGIDGDEIIHSLLDIMYADVPYTVISRAVHNHPTISELIPTILQDLKPLEL